MPDDTVASSYKRVLCVFCPCKSTLNLVIGKNVSETQQIPLIYGFIIVGTSPPLTLPHLSSLSFQQVLVIYGFACLGTSVKAEKRNLLFINSLSLFSTFKYLWRPFYFLCVRTHATAFWKSVRVSVFVCAEVRRCDFFFVSAPEWGGEQLLCVLKKQHHLRKALSLLRRSHLLLFISGLKKN